MRNSLARKIRKAREELDLTQEELGDKVGVSSAAVSHWENGISMPSPGVIRHLEAVLGLLVDSDVSSFGIWLGNARRAAGMSIQELAKRAKVTATTINNIESGKSKNPQSTIRNKLSSVLGQKVPSQIVEETEEEQVIEGLGNLTDFDPYEESDLPQCAGVYVLYDISQRPVYVGKSKNIANRIKNHSQSFWFKSPIVEFGSFIEVNNKTLRG